MDLSGFSEVLNNTGIMNLGLDQAVMALVCLGLIYLAIAREFEPLLLIPIGFGGLFANVPLAGITEADGFLGILYETGVANGLFPLLIFVGVGALTDFGPLLANPKTALLGAAAQFGIFATLIGALVLSDSVARDRLLHPERRRHRHHRWGRRANRHLPRQSPKPRAPRRHRGLGLFVYGVSPHHPAADHELAHHVG